ncbi:MAG: alpha-L-fucosidase [Fimbriimonadaceae bacterium]|nr:alpha-L-fucosidase [Fimbriimonadaceae bacterium]
MLLPILASLLCLETGEPGPRSPAPFGPVPSENQLRWHELEYYAFIHFSLNTYTDQSWGFGNEDVRLFNPSQLDAREWARVIKKSGMKGVILTAKHHGGFCLWPSRHTDYSVKNSPWKQGKGDVVRELAEACREYGLKFGVYLSPWDRNHADYGRPEYITYFRNQLTELLTDYGPIFEVWFDGANGGSGWYGGANEHRQIDPKTYYDWPNTYALVRRLQPKIVIWNDGGDRADLRWVGTEAGYVGETNWSLLNAQGDVTWPMLHHGLEDGDSWVPAEVNTSIRPEWFYHPSEDDKVKTVARLLDAYYASVGRNAALLLNFPIRPDGTIHPTDAARAIETGEIIRKTFAKNLARGAAAEASNIRGRSSDFGPENALDDRPDSFWSVDDGVLQASLTLTFKKPTSFNRFLVQERIALGQRVKAFQVEAFVDGGWREIGRGTTVGAKRILRFPTLEASKVRLTILDSKAPPVISHIGIHLAPPILDAPSILRNRAGDVLIEILDVGPHVHYTLDGTTPSRQSPRATGPIPTTDGKVVVQAVAIDPSGGQVGPVRRQAFDVSRKAWRFPSLGADADALLDGRDDTSWKMAESTGLPADLVLDLGREHRLSGFRLLPDQNMGASGVITRYELHVSQDGTAWTKVDEGEFANVRNNRTWQVKRFSPTPARFLKLRALATTDTSPNITLADIDVLTE